MCCNILYVSLRPYCKCLFSLEINEEFESVECA